jgi:hypothetical protein
MSGAAHGFVCPWVCLAPSPSKVPVVSPSPTVNRSFAQALLNKEEVTLTHLPKPCVKGNSLAIKITEEVYQSGIANCTNYLHGRLVPSRGDKPLSSKDLREKLLRLWKPIDKWKMIPLGRGYYEFRFSSAEDRKSVWSSGVWNLNPGLLRLSSWSPDFNPLKQKQTHCQVWVRFHCLPLEYWQTRILFEIAAAIGTPISIDDNTRNHTFGHYARVLVDINLSNNLHDSLLVEREKFAFNIDLEYEKLPFFGSSCNCIGHSFESCKKGANKYASDNIVTKDDAIKKIRQGVAPKKPVNKGETTTAPDETKKNLDDLDKDMDDDISNHDDSLHPDSPMYNDAVQNFQDLEHSNSADVTISGHQDHTPKATYMPHLITDPPTVTSKVIGCASTSASEVAETDDVQFESQPYANNDNRIPSKLWANDLEDLEESPDEGEYTEVVSKKEAE